MSHPRFLWSDPAAKAFFDEHGFVVVHSVLDSAARDALRDGWCDVVAQAATKIGMESSQFAQRFPQNRDLWRKHPNFERMIFQTPQWEAAAYCLGVSGVRLFHDHAIIKPAAQSGTIPWHQDSSYWPLDRAGISLWTPLESVPINGGCLKVLDGSHQDGPSAPQDFLANVDDTKNRDKRLTYIPVEQGETVILHGLTWHASEPNSAESDRLAYLSLWVPATARFVPEHASWHPAAAHIRVQAGERLDGDWFPCFGKIASEDEGLAVKFPLPAQTSGPTMFRAGKDIAKQVAWLMGDARADLELLLTKYSPPMIAEVAVAAGLLSPGDEGALCETLHALALQERVRKESVARDVYLGAAARWWQLIGTRISESCDVG